MKKRVKKYTFTDRLLLLIAEVRDFHYASFSVQRALLYTSGHPALHKHSRRMKRLIHNRKKKQQMYATLYSLKKRKIIQLKDGQRGFVLTEKGKERILQLKAPRKPKKRLPHHQWLMVFFDIPEKLKKSRDMFRFTLRNLGFQPVQKSIWVTPHDVLKDIKEIIRNHQLQNYVKFLIVKEIEI